MWCPTMKTRGFPSAVMGVSGACWTSAPGTSLSPPSALAHLIPAASPRVRSRCSPRCAGRSRSNSSAPGAGAGKTPDTAAGWGGGQLHRQDQRPGPRQEVGTGFPEATVGPGGALPSFLRPADVLLGLRGPSQGRRHLRGAIQEPDSNPRKETCNSTYPSPASPGLCQRAGLPPSHPRSPD